MDDYDAVLDELLALRERVSRYAREIEVLRHERDNARLGYEQSTRILTGIHRLLYPSPVTTAQGMKFVFHSPLVHEQMQALSDRIRAIPDEIADIQAVRAD